MARVFVIDNNGNDKLIASLREYGYEVTVFADGDDGFRRCTAQPPDLVIAELTSPGMGGTEICRSLRSSHRTRRLPIILTGQSTEEIDCVVAFELGADDYVIKPYSARELTLRVRAILRRYGRRERRRELVRQGDITVDALAHRVTFNGEEVRVSLLEFKLLSILFQANSRVVTRARLLAEIWEDRAVSTRTVDSCVKRLRSKLGPGGKYIETVRGVGYRLVPQES